MGRITISGRTIIAAVLIFVTVTGSSQGGRWTVEELFAGGFPATSREIDDHKVEQAWSHCRKKLIDRIALDSPKYLSQESLVELKLAVFAKPNVNKATRVLYPLSKQSFLECLEKQHVLSLRSSREKCPKSRSVKGFEVLSSLPSIPRRYLISKPHLNTSRLDRHHQVKPRDENASRRHQPFKPRHKIAPSGHRPFKPRHENAQSRHRPSKPRHENAPSRHLPFKPMHNNAPGRHQQLKRRHKNAPSTSPPRNFAVVSAVGAPNGLAPPVSGPTQLDRHNPSKPRHVNAPSTSPPKNLKVVSSVGVPGGSAPDSGPTPAPEPAYAPSPDRQPPVKPPSMSPRSTPSYLSPRPQKQQPPSPPARSDNAPHMFSDHELEIIIASSITAAATLVIVALLFFCVFKDRSKKVGPGDGQRDERPLLNLRFSNLSSGSSGKSQSMENPSNKNLRADSVKHPSVLSNLSPNFDKDASLATKQPSSEATPSGVIGPLKPPPGRIIVPSADPRQPPPPPPPPAPAPPPPPKARPPPLPPKMPVKKQNDNSSDGDSLNGASEAPKAKLKPFFWDKVLADPEHSMVWHEIKAGSFQFNEEMMESLFGYANTDRNKNGHKKESPSLEPVQYIQIIDSKKAQNLSILLRALNLTAEEVSDALHEGSELPVELIQTLLKMAPTAEEELKLRLYSGDISQLGPAERFLKLLVEIPFAFKRLEALLFMTSLEEEASGIKEAIETLEVACNKLRHNRLFLKLLEAVLKTGNRMNDGTYRGGAQAFKLDTLLKLADVKGTDGKITLLHFVVQEIIRSEGIRAARAAKASQDSSSVKTEDVAADNSHGPVYYRNLGLQVVSGLSTELEDVKKAAVIDADSLTSILSKLGSSLKKAKNFLNSELKSLDEDSEFCNTLASFVENAEGEISHLVEEEKRIMTLVKNTADYFHGNAGKNEGLRLFVIVRDFLRMLDKTSKEVRDSPWEPVKPPKKGAQKTPSSPDSRQQSPDIRQRLFPAIVDRRVDYSSSDDESSSP